MYPKFIETVACHLAARARGPARHTATSQPFKATHIATILRFQATIAATILTTAARHRSSASFIKIVSPTFLLRPLCFAATMSTSAELSTSLQVKKLSPSATIPTRGSPLSAGFDLSANEKKVIPAGGRGVVKTDISIACPAGTYARIAPRSGLAVKKGIDVGAGVVDADYRGNVGVVLFNFGTEDFTVDVGDRIAQLILEKVNMAPVVEVEELTETERGAGGFGSTGVKESDAPQAKKQRTISPMPPAEGEAAK